MNEGFVMPPKISVILPVYNCGATLTDAIESIIKQTFSDWELIICDDCSTDESYQIALNYENMYPDKIKVLRNDKNLMIAKSLNRCLKASCGEYIARMDGDDTCDEKRFELK